MTTPTRHSTDFERGLREAAEVALTALDAIYREWDGEPEDMVEAQEARAQLRAALIPPVKP